MSKAEKLAEEYVFHQQNEAKRCCDDCNIKFINANVYVTRAFLAGWNACVQDLRERSEEFDIDEAYRVCEEIHLARECTCDIDDLGCVYRDEKYCAVKAMKYQHSQDQLVINVLKQGFAEMARRNQELENELANANKFAQDQENELAKLKARYEVKYEGRS